MHVLRLLLRLCMRRAFAFLTLCNLFRLSGETHRVVIAHITVCAASSRLDLAPFQSASPVFCLLPAMQAAAVAAAQQQAVLKQHFEAQQVKAQQAQQQADWRTAVAIAQQAQHAQQVCAVSAWALRASQCMSVCARLAL